jgi:uncharacterized protein YjhX (UPF0386 family)
MRTYIFTDRERRILETWLGGGRVEIKAISQVLSRIKSFNRLGNDIDLYLVAKRRLKAKPSKTAST